MRFLKSHFPHCKQILIYSSGIPWGWGEEGGSIIQGGALQTLFFK